MDFIYVFKKHWNLAKGERYKVIIYVTLHILSVVAITAQPIAFAMVINVLQKHNDQMIQDVSKWLLIYVACFYMFEICHRMARGIEIGVAYRNKKRFVLSSYQYLQSLPLSWHMKHHSGSVVSRINKASDALLNFGQSLYEYITAFVRFLVAVCVLWVISPVIALVSLVAGWILIVVTKRFYKNFDESRFYELSKMFDLELDKKLEQLSSGMKVKYSILMALSHNAELLTSVCFSESNFSDSSADMGIKDSPFENNLNNRFCIQLPQCNNNSPLFIFLNVRNVFIFILFKAILYVNTLICDLMSLA